MPHSASILKVTGYPDYFLWIILVGLRKWWDSRPTLEQRAIDFFSSDVTIILSHITLLFAPTYATEQSYYINQESSTMCPFSKWFPYQIYISVMCLFQHRSQPRVEANITALVQLLRHYLQSSANHKVAYICFNLGSTTNEIGVHTVITTKAWPFSSLHYQ